MRNTVRMINPCDRWIAWIWITRGVSIRFHPLLSFLSVISIVVSVTSFVSLFSFCFLFFIKFIPQCYFAHRMENRTSRFFFPFSSRLSGILSLAVSTQKHRAQRYMEADYGCSAKNRVFLTTRTNRCANFSERTLYIFLVHPSYTCYGYVRLNKPAFYCSLHIVRVRGLIPELAQWCSAKLLWKPGEIFPSLLFFYAQRGISRSWRGNIFNCFLTRAR